nr:hypothetical protein [Tanacetum cinerariifolium]
MVVHSQNTNLTTFQLPSPLPKWPQGGGFASGSIDLGGLQVSQVTNFTKIWATNEGGTDNLGVTFYDPVTVPQGFTSLGSYAQPNNIPLFGHILVAKDVSNNSSKPTIKSPIDYTLVWSSVSLDIKKDGEGYIWFPVAPEGYKAIGYVASGSSDKPPLDKVSCVREDFADTTNVTSGLKSDHNDINLNGLNVRDSIGGFIVQNMSVGNLKGNTSNSMPNLNQVKALIQAYAPVIRFHPDEQYLPSSVDWFFQNGALLYHKGDESKPNRIENN